MRDAKSSDSKSKEERIAYGCGKGESVQSGVERAGRRFKGVSGCSGTAGRSSTIMWRDFRMAARSLGGFPAGFEASGGVFGRDVILQVLDSFFLLGDDPFH
jgi:hypothetical protein